MSEDSNGEVDPHIVASYREHIEGYHERDPDAYPHTGTIRDGGLSRFVAVVEQEYDPARECADPGRMPGSADDLQMVQNVRRMEATEHGRRALKDGDMGTLQHQQGDTNQRADVSGMQAIGTLKSFMTGPAPMFYEWAEPGTGKTNFALLLGQLWKRQFANGLVASNVRTLKETDNWEDTQGVERDGWLASFGELEEWMQQDGDPVDNEQTPKLFIFDEASSNAGGGGSDGYQTKQKMGPMAYKIRKYGGSLIVIGHDGKDVHPLIREMGVCVHKEDLKRATFYEDVKNRSGVGELASVEGIPETDWRYDDKEATAWSWRTHGDEEMGPDEAAENVFLWQVRRHFEEGVSARKSAERVPYSRDWTSRRYRWLKNDEFPHERADTVEELTA
jgi:hypothetical protein